MSASELLMRKVPAGGHFFNPARPAESPLGVTWLAFKPTREDSDGLSLSRMKSAAYPDFLSLEQFAARICDGKAPEKHFYITVLSVDELIDPMGLALQLTPDPVDRDPGHLLIPRLNSALDKPTRDSFALTLARAHCQRLIGPFNCNGQVVSSFIDWHRP